MAMPSSDSREWLEDVRLVRAVEASRKVGVLTGAGISAESGIPTFRGAEGLWKRFRPEELANLEAFLANPEAAYITGQCICIDGGETA